MKRLLIFAVFYLSIAVCDVGRSQMQFDSVLIELKNIPSIRKYDVNRDLGQDSYYENYGAESFSRSVVDSITTIINKDTILVSGYSTWDGWQTKQELIITVDSGLWNSYSIQYNEWYKENRHPLNFDFSFKKVRYKFDGNINIFSVLGMPLVDHLMSYSFHKIDFSDAPHIVTTINKSISGNFTNYSEATIQLFSSEPLTVKGSQVQKFSCCPNPASSTITITSLEPQETIRIFDQLGREVHIPEISRTDESVSFNTSSLIPGIYWLRIGSHTQKIVIQR